MFTRLRRLAFGSVVGLFVVHAQTGFATLAPITGISRLAAGEGSFALALRRDGVLFAWGANATGTHGDGTTDPSLTPSPVPIPGGAADIVAFAPASVHALALKADGTVLAWGTNGLGAVGDGTFTNRLTPVQVSGLGSGSGVIAIATGLSHSVAAKDDGSVWAWGSNNQTNLGNPSVVGPSNEPVPVTNLGPGSGVIALAGGGNFTLALKSDGTVWAWGNNNNGQLGIGSFTNQPVPVQVKGPGGAGFLDDVVAISAPPANGGAFALALKGDGTVWAWGINANGQLGDGTTTTRALPVQVQELTDVVAVDAAGTQGNQHSLALRSDGALFAWGSNANGQLGTGNNQPSVVPRPVVGLGAGSNVVEISAGTGLSLARKADGSVLAWGDNGSGQLGDGTFFGRPSPDLVAGLSAGSGIRAVASGIAANHSFAVRDDGTLLAWGNNSAGQLGIGTTAMQRTPVNVAGLTGVVAAAAGANHSIALTADGSVWAWGDNSTGQLGIGSLTGQRTPVPVRTSALALLPVAISIAAANNSSYALTADGAVWAWGTNNTAQLGIGSTANQGFAVQVHGVNNVGFLGGVTAIATSGGTAYALKPDGTVLGWGQNAAGQVGDGTTVQRTTPVQVAGLGPGSGIVAIAAINSGAAALRGDGTVLSWGLNSGGQVGDGTTVQRWSPVPSGVGFGITAVSGGGSIGDGQTLAVTSDGSALSWGSNGSGQLGDGTLSQHTLPAPIPALPSGVTSVAAGTAHSIALSADGSVRAWGANGTGQLGDGTVYTSNLTPKNVLIDDVTAPAVTLSASRNVLTPPNGRMVPVSFSGHMTDVDTGVDPLTALFVVTDEYGRVQPSGAVVLDESGSYNLTLQLEALRNEQDKSGRHYTVRVSARDRAGNLGFSEVSIVVPHDRRDR